MGLWTDDVKEMHWSTCSDPLKSKPNLIGVCRREFEVQKTHRFSRSMQILAIRPDWETNWNPYYFPLYLINGRENVQKHSIYTRAHNTFHVDLHSCFPHYCQDFVRFLRKSTPSLLSFSLVERRVLPFLLTILGNERNPNQKMRVMTCHEASLREHNPSPSDAN